jgi:peptidoglycan/LPS O-acetylase OafA/YrhL
LRESGEAREREIPQGRVLFDFYVRRILRIWPAYYFVLIAAVILGATSVERTFAWHAFYSTNILVFLEDDWYPLMTGHLWTLSVEEQFYLVLPLVVLFIPRNALKPLLIGSIAAAIFSRGVICLLAVRRDFFPVLPIAQLDALGGGALLALLQHQKGQINWKTLLAWSLPLAILLDVFHTFSAVHFTFVTAAYVLPMVAIVSSADAGVKGWLGTILSSRVLVTMGRISYGIYLYHLFIAAGADSVMRSMGEVPFGPGPARFLVLSSLTILAATVSWVVIERPALSLRRYFRRATESATVVPAAPRLA